MKQILPPEHWATEDAASAALSSAFWYLEQALHLMREERFSEASEHFQQAEDLLDDALELITGAIGDSK